MEAIWMTFGAAILGFVVAAVVVIQKDRSRRSW